MESTELQPLNKEIAIYNNASMLVIEKEEQIKLTAPFDEKMIEIRPDGLIYLPQTFWRQRLNETFGIGQWCLVIKGQHKDPDPNKDKLYLQGILMVRGSYMSEAVGEAELHSKNSQQSWASVWESAKSDCITRCCKDLSIASELWQPQFINKWKSDHAVEVWVEVDYNGQKKSKKQWRKKDAPPLWNEKNAPKAETKKEDAKPVTSYNHAPVAKDEKPVATNGQFKNLLERMKQENPREIYEQAIAHFSFVEEQKKLLDLTLETQEITPGELEEWKQNIEQCKTPEELKKFKTSNSPFILENFKVFTILSNHQQKLAS